MHSSDCGRLNHHLIVCPYQCQGHETFKLVDLAFASLVRDDLCLIVGKATGCQLQRQAKRRLSPFSREGPSHISAKANADLSLIRTQAHSDKSRCLRARGHRCASTRFLQDLDSCGPWRSRTLTAHGRLTFRCYLGLTWFSYQCVPLIYRQSSPCSGPLPRRLQPSSNQVDLLIWARSHVLSLRELTFSYWTLRRSRHFFSCFYTRLIYHL